MSDPGFADVTVHPRFEFGWNKLQTIIEAGVTIIVIAGGLGIFGGGPFSQVSVEIPGSRDVLTYDRFARRTVKNGLTVDVREPAAQPWIDVTLPQSFLERNEITGTSPRSSRAVADGGGVTYRFDLGPGHTGEIVLFLKPGSFGWTKAQTDIDGSRVVLNQFVWP